MVAAFRQIACAIRRHLRRSVVILAVAALVVAGYVLLLFRAAENTRQDEARALQRRAEAAEERRVVCARINELPGKLALAIALSEQRRALVGPTTTVPPPDLTPEEQEELERVEANLRAVVADLGRPVACDTTPTTAGRRP